MRGILVSLTLCLSLWSMGLPTFSAGEETLSLDQLRQQIKTLNETLDELQRDSIRYQAEVTKQRQTASSLKNTLALLDAQIKKTNGEITTTKLEIQKKLLEISSTKKQINKRDVSINEERVRLSEAVRQWQKLEKTPWWTALTSPQPISAAFQQLQFHQSLQKTINDTLIILHTERQSLQNAKNKLETEQRDLQDLQKRLENKLTQLQSQQTSKAALLQQTKNSEKRYLELLNAAVTEQLRADQEIKRLERLARELLARQHRSLGSKITWPVPSRIVTTLFHDPDYPFRKRFQHSGIDIRAGQGTPVAAAEEGYVAIAKNAGLGYSYVLIVHGQGISTVYGHLSSIAVQTGQFVARGQNIGRSGGMPGTLGAGPFVTGPHLHFEVRLNGEPVDPLRYL